MALLKQKVEQHEEILDAYKQSFDTLNDSINRLNLTLNTMQIQQNQLIDSSKNNNGFRQQILIAAIAAILTFTLGTVAVSFNTNNHSQSVTAEVTK